MVKYLFICRHAKSDWSDSGAADFERNLNPRGYADAPMMGDVLNKLAVKPDLIVSSPAVRARSTAELFAKKLSYDMDEIVLEEGIYEASVRELLMIINKLPADKNEVMLFGHNPSMTYLAEYLSKRQIGNMPTSSVAKLMFEDLEWGEVSEGSAILAWFEYPKKHK